MKQPTFFFLTLKNRCQNCAINKKSFTQPISERSQVPGRQNGLTCAQESGQPAVALFAVTSVGAVQIGARCIYVALVRPAFRNTLVNICKTNVLVHTDVQRFALDTHTHTHTYTHMHMHTHTHTHTYTHVDFNNICRRPTARPRTLTGRPTSTPSIG